MDDLVIIPAPRNSDGYAYLSRSRMGKLYKKHILNLGPLNYNGTVYNLDDSWYARLKDNFNSGVADIVQVPLANDANQHSEDPARNLGEVVDIEREGDKVYAVIDARKQADDFGKTLLGASAFLHMNYTDTATQRRVGPALLHVAVTNRPYITKLEPYQEIIAASADGTGDVVVLASEEEQVSMTREEMLAALKDEHGIDVEALQSAASQKTDTAQLTAAIADALRSTGTVKLSGGSDGVDAETLTGAIVELANTTKEQGEVIGHLRRQAAETEVDGYISAGRVLPKQRAAMVELALTNRDMLDQLLPGEPLVKLSHQDGVTPPDGEGAHEVDIDAEVARLSAEHAKISGENRSGSVRR